MRRGKKGRMGCAEDSRDGPTLPGRRRSCECTAGLSTVSEGVVADVQPTNGAELAQKTSSKIGGRGTVLVITSKEDVEIGRQRLGSDESIELKDRFV